MLPGQEQHAACTQTSKDDPEKNLIITFGESVDCLHSDIVFIVIATRLVLPKKCSKPKLILETTGGKCSPGQYSLQKIFSFKINLAFALKQDLFTYPVC